MEQYSWHTVSYSGHHILRRVLNWFRYYYWILELVQRKATKWLTVLETKPVRNDKCCIFGKCSMGKRKLREVVTNTFNYLNGCLTQKKTPSVSSEGKTKSNELKLQASRLRLDLRKNFLTLRAAQKTVCLLAPLRGSL